MSKNKTKEKEKSFSEYKKEFHTKTDRHILELEALLPTPSKFKLIKISNNLRIFSNEITSIVNNRLKQLKRNNTYTNLKQDYKTIKTKIDKYDKQLNKDKDTKTLNKKQINNIKNKLKILNNNLKQTSNELQILIKQYQLSFEDVRLLSIEIAKKYNIGSIYIRSETENIYKGVEKVLYSDGKQLHFKKKGTMPTIRAKQIERGIVPFIDIDDKLKIKFGNTKNDKQITISLKFKDNDTFVLDELELVKLNLTDNTINDLAVLDYIKNNTITDTFRICYVQIVFKEIRGVIRLFVQFVIEGKALPKKDKYGRSRHVKTKGTIGLDLGPSTFAVVSENKAFVKNLAERNNKSTLSTEKKEKYYLRKLDSSRRINNPDNYNTDGTIKKNTKTFKRKWVKTKNYKKYEYRLKELERKNALNRKYAINEDLNILGTFGDTVITEKNEAKKLQKKANKTKRQEKKSIITKKDGTEITVNKYEKKKRYGKSIKNRCPGYFNSELKKRFKVKEVNTIKFRASQYDHKNDTYTKKKLSEREHIFSDGTKVQRDMYSAFLMYCANEDLESIDRNKCNKLFNKFKINQDAYLRYIELNNINVLNIK